MKLIKIIVILFLVFNVISCATIIHGKTQDIKFVSDEPVKVYIFGEYIGETPLIYNLTKKRTIMRGGIYSPFIPVTIESDGSSKQYNFVGKEYSLISFISGLLIIPIIIDEINGASFKYPKIINIDVQRKKDV